MGLDGAVSVTYIGYHISSDLGVFISLSLFIFWIISIVSRAINTILKTPQHLKAYNEKRAQIKGMQALSYGLSAVAAGV